MHITKSELTHLLHTEQTTITIILALQFPCTFDHSFHFCTFIVIVEYPFVDSDLGLLVSSTSG